MLFYISDVEFQKRKELMLIQNMCDGCSHRVEGDSNFDRLSGLAREEMPKTHKLTSLDAVVTSTIMTAKHRTIYHYLSCCNKDCIV